MVVKDETVKDHKMGGSVLSRGIQGKSDAIGMMNLDIVSDIAHISKIG